jgi:hypothetical protein
MFHECLLMGEWQHNLSNYRANSQAVEFKKVIA